MPAEDDDDDGYGAFNEHDTKNTGKSTGQHVAKYIGVQPVERRYQNQMHSISVQPVEGGYQNQTKLDSGTHGVDSKLSSGKHRTSIYRGFEDLDSDVDI